MSNKTNVKSIDTVDDAETMQDFYNEWFYEKSSVVRNKTVEQLQADVREHLADKWDVLPIIEREEYISGVRDWTELHHDAFNSDYYIIGTWRATQWLGDCVFQVMEVIK